MNRSGIAANSEARREQQGWDTNQAIQTEALLGHAPYELCLHRSSHGYFFFGHNGMQEAGLSGRV